MTVTAEVKALLDEQLNLVQQFRDENDKGAKANAEALDRMNGRLDQIELQVKRVGRVPANDNREPDSPERKAYHDYLRTGQVVDESKALTTTDQTQAGYLAPTETVREIIKAETEISPIRQVARVRTTTAKSVEIPKRTGQFAAVWIGETETRSETEGLTYDLEEIPTHEMTAKVHISEQMLEDSGFDLEAELNTEFSEQFAVAEGLALVSGTGTKQPEGFLTSSDVGSTNSGNASLLTADGLIDLYHALKTAYAVRSTWLLNRSTLGAVRKLKDDQSQYLWQPGLAGLRPATILDAPYVEVPDMPSVAANAFPIGFGDWGRGYYVVDRLSMSVLRDPYTLGDSGQVKFRARRRVGGQVVLAEAIRLQKVAA